MMVSTASLPCKVPKLTSILHEGKPIPKCFFFSSVVLLFDMQHSGVSNADYCHVYLLCIRWILLSLLILSEGLHLKEVSLFLLIISRTAQKWDQRNIPVNK